MIFLKKVQRFCLVLVLFSGIIPCHAIIPEDGNSNYIQSLNGLWKFKLVEMNDSLNVQFKDNGFNDDDWGNINVPGNWELEGFEEPRYYSPDKNWVGLYKKKLNSAF